MAFTASDELDDGLAYTFDTHSDTEAADLAPLEDEEEEIVKTKKRVLPESNGDKPQKKKKKTKNESAVEKKKEKAEIYSQAKVELALKDSAMIADFIAAKVRAKNPDLSNIEINELTISEKQIKETASWRTPRVDDKLARFLEKNACDKWTIVLSISAIRVCDVHRNLKPLKAGSIKFIKKNTIKNDTIAVEKTQASVGVATPGRLLRLLDSKVLTPKDIKAIVVESTYLDSKKNSVWDLEETIPAIKRVLDESDAKVMLY
ncbi:U3-containing 90S pre-ribosomal complex subunit-domain containing protein [Yarrowia lipolytica]|jgi:protein CMS1|uniref:U3-containing 90S pre-ribosomal complex subunit-domain containing protein n=1 Tax=Yarrowia lipolytica TaxID=4952 RepID=A0A371CCN9_YARLL|nr:Protein CMS1 [Yarrowia lipolytica]RDW28074.1 U3-containing 90S pre-ribosomal complex subunit-domain containing protein [Yarrowia lipolytica]RDW48372.1 U3-containing 90S pre-ribosomal complex subunit-domain containing protein [Yarrowia lipolytica]RDW54813.1 U3-containing 90S pre-ribosomal complex subunit-domain containing protein [Yarrowia lipolytica]VBB87493.1 Subunit of the 90S preribosome processome complex, putative [Yarrowia lipolytica]